jgi:subtilisin family serine protease
MKRRLLYLFIVLFTASAGFAGVFPASTLIEIAKQHKTRSASQHEVVVQAFVTADNPVTLSQLSAMGATVNSSFGNTATVTIPLSDVGSLAAVKGIKRIELSRHLTLCNNMARELSHFPSMTYVQDGYTSPAYTGSGVVVGMIDVGIDFNHINFLDKDGNNRIVRVYLPTDSTGTSPVVDGLTLPGSEYTTPEQISALTTDDPKEMHGTHTTGTAAGSYLANGLNGIATGAQIVACAMPDNSLTDANVANSVRYIFDYADKVGLPAVINMSIGSQEGAHDGTSPLCRLYNDVSGPGRICVVSAGNDAHMPMNLRKKLGENDSLATFLSNWYSREPMRGYSSMWSKSATRHTVDIVIWDILADTLVHRLDVPRDAELDSVYTVSSETDSIFARYYTGELYFACAIEDNGHFHSLVETDYTSHERSHYRIGIINKAPANETLMGWSGGMVVYSKAGLDGWISGLVGYGCSVSDLATADSVISVGAYCSNNSFVMMDGDTVTFARCTPFDLAYFSGFGPDARNRQRPDVVAPGYEVASSVSRFVDAYQLPHNIVDNVNINGEYYPYGLDGGTSMSTPVVSGTIALWLEIDPTLSPANIRQIMEATCYRDSYVENGAPKKWGYGKLDIEAGIKYLIAKLDGDVNGDGVVTASDITCLYNILLGVSMQYINRADLNCDGAITASDVTCEYERLLGM